MSIRDTLRNDESAADEARLGPECLEAACLEPECLGGIEDESAWRVPPRQTSGRKVIATRWQLQEAMLSEVGAATPQDYHVVSLSLRSSHLRVSIADEVVFNGAAMPGILLVTQPSVVARCFFAGPCDELHLYLPNDLVSECTREAHGLAGQGLRTQLLPRRDPIVERLGRTLLSADDISGAFGQLYLESVATAIVARLLSTPGELADAKPRREAELVRWRLRRVTDYIEAHLAEPMTLSDMAESAGLTRMHFAAQFRAATGLRPHEYLLRRRIERAQQMMVETRRPLVEVALSVGFQTQSHFTGVFSKFVGRPPRHWRQQQTNAGPSLSPSASNLAQSASNGMCRTKPSSLRMDQTVRAQDPRSSGITPSTH